MVRLQVARFRLILVLLLASGLANGWVCLSATLARSPSPAPEKSRAWPFSGTTVISDFDGDNRSDIATSRIDGSNYKVEIQFSSRQEKASFSLPSSGLGMGFFACDINHDNDNDIVITSPTSLQPLAVWLGDGHGNFERDYNWSSPDLLASDSSPSYEQNGGRLDPASINQNDRLPSDRSTSGLISAELEVTGSISDHWLGLSLQTLAYKLTSRGPPLNTIL